MPRTGYHGGPPYYHYPGYYRHYYPGYSPGWYWNSAFWYPYGFGAWGLGWYAYDPWIGWGVPGPYYGGGYGYSYADDTGDVRLKIKPRDAQVYVDGGYVGIIDEFDGTFQRLRLNVGTHKIEVRKEGLEPLVFDVNVTPDHTITLSGELQSAVQ